MSLRTYPKKRLDIFVEAPAADQVTEALLSAGVQGFTILQASAGQGHGGSWQIDDSFNDASHVVCIVCLLDAAKVDDAITAVFEIVKRQIGVLTVSDVMVVRPEHF